MGVDFQGDCHSLVSPWEVMLQTLQVKIRDEELFLWEEEVWQNLGSREFG